MGTFVFISDNDRQYFYKGYRIFRNEINRDLWGIKSPEGVHIIDPIFQRIEWRKGVEWKNTPTLVIFSLNNKQAVCTFEQMLKLKFQNH